MSLNASIVRTEALSWIVWFELLSLTGTCDAESFSSTMVCSFEVLPSNKSVISLEVCDWFFFDVLKSFGSVTGWLPWLSFHHPPAKTRAMIPQRGGGSIKFLKSPRTRVTVFAILWGWKDSIFPAAYDDPGSESLSLGPFAINCINLSCHVAFSLISLAIWSLFSLFVRASSSCCDLKNLLSSVSTVIFASKISASRSSLARERSPLHRRWSLCPSRHLSCILWLSAFLFFLPCFSFFLSFFFQKSLRELSSSRLPSSILDCLVSGPKLASKGSPCSKELGRPSCQ